MLDLVDMLNRNAILVSLAVAVLLGAAALWYFNQKPRVLIIGDSISIGYTEPVRQRLASVANVTRIPGNGNSTSYALEAIEEWLRKQKPAIIYFNFGLHDLLHQVGRETYANNLRTIVIRLRQTGAKLIFAEMTVVPPSRLNYFPDQQDAYRETAANVMREMGVPTDSLHHVAAEQIPDDVHFTPKGSESLADHVATTIRDALGR